MEVFRRAAESRVRCDACTLGGPGLQPCLDFVRGPFTSSRFVRAAKAQSLAFYRSSRGASSSTPPRRERNCTVAASLSELPHLKIPAHGWWKSHALSDCPLQADRAWFSSGSRPGWIAS